MIAFFFFFIWRIARISCYLDFRNYSLLWVTVSFPLSFLKGTGRCPVHHAVTWGFTRIILNSLSCFRLASMGLADMMSPGESKLPLPLKADGKEEGAPQPESKAKVLPLCTGLPLTCTSASLVLPHRFRLLSACFTVHMSEPLSPHPSRRGSESY